MSDTKKNSLNSKERRGISLEATWEVESLINRMLKEVNSGELELHIDAEMMLRGVGCRVKQLNSIIMSAAGDKSESTDELRDRLYGGRHNGPTRSEVRNG